MKRLLTLFWLLLPLLGVGQSAKTIKFTQSPTGVVAAWQQKQAGVDTGPDSWTRITTTQGLTLQARGAAVVKPVSRSYPAANATLDFSLYRPMVWPDGFVATTFYRRTDVGLSDQFRYVQTMGHRSLTDAELADPALKSRVYWDITANTLGPLQSAPALLDASVTTLLNQFNANVNANCVGGASLVFNFETVSFPPNINKWNNPGAPVEDQGVLQFYPDAETHTWLCESASLKGQTLTLRQIFDAGKFAEECRQRTVNRAVALNRFFQAKCGPNTYVLNGDGHQNHFNGSVAFVDNYATLKAATQDRGYNPELWYLPANFDPITIGGVSVTHGGQTFWQTQGYLNDYTYVNEAVVSSADFDYITSLPAGAYRQYWPRLRMAVDRSDVSIPASLLLNRAKLIQKGMPQKPVRQQSHNRLETRVRSTDGRVSEMGNLGPDARLAPPWMVEMWTMTTRMVCTKKGDGFTLWTTQPKGGPGVSDEANAWSNRPLDERMGMYTGLARMYQFREYFPADESKIKLFGPDDCYVKYTNGITGGNWAGSAQPVITDGGDGYYRRSSNQIVHHQNPSDIRSKTGVMARVMQKTAPGGVPVRWAIIMATNPDLASGQLSTFNVRFKAADLGTSSDIDVTGLTVGGKETMLVEVCLEPSKLTVPVLTSVGSTAGGSSPPSYTTTPPTNTTAAVVSYSKVLVIGNSITFYPAVPQAPVFWPNAWGMAASAESKDFLHLLKAKLQTLNLAVEVRGCHSWDGQGNGLLNPGTGPDWEQHYVQYSNGSEDRSLSRFQLARDWQPDLIVMRVAENVDNAQVDARNFKTHYKTLIDYLRNGRSVPVVLSTSCWGQSNTSAHIAQVAAERNYPLADLGDIWADEANFPNRSSGSFTGTHPGDVGMARIADRIWAKIPKGNGSSGGSTVPAGDKFFGFTFTPLAPFPFPANTPRSYNASARVVTIETDRIKVERDLNTGGAITGVYEKVNGVWTLNYVNNYDKGRQIVSGFWSGPYPFNPPGYEKAPGAHEFSKGPWNPNEGGDWMGRNGTITDLGFDPGTQTYYIRSRAVNFMAAGYDTGLYIERWMRAVAPNVVRNWFRVTWDRSIEPVPILDRWPADNLEMPTVYGNLGAAYKGVYVGANGTVLTRDLRSGVNAPTTLAGEPWMGLVNDGNRGIGISGPDIWNVMCQIHYNYSPGNVSETSGDAAYLCNSVGTNMNATGTLYYMYDVVVGSVEEIRQAAKLHPASNPANNAPHWSFTGSAHHGFRVLNGLKNNEGSGSALVVDIEKNNVEIKGPGGVFRAVDVPTLYIRLKNESDTDRLKLGWRKPGDNDGMFAPEVDVICPRDGQYHTVPLNLSSNSNWTGEIALLKLRLDAGNENNVSGQGKRLSLHYMGKTNPD